MEKKKFILRAGIGVIAVLIIAFIFGVKSLYQNNLKLDEETRKMLEYPVVGENGDQGAKTESDYVEFDAYFAKDINNDGIAEKIRGTCMSIGESDTIYMEFNVLTKGYLKDGKITVNGDNNCYLETAIVKDSVIAQNYISSNTKEIKFNESVGEGTQKTLTAIVKSGDYSYTSRKAEAIGNNINNYSKINSITFTGTHVEETESGEIETPIKKTVPFTVDWHGTAKTELSNLYQYKNLQTAIDNEAGEINIEFTIEPTEVKKELLLSKMHLEGTVPALNGARPKKVEISGNSTYEEATGKFVIEETAEVNEAGQIIKKVYSNNRYRIKVTYPLDTEIGINTIEYRLPVSAYYEGYNHTEFTNPYKTNIAQSTYVITFRNPQGEKERFDVTVGKYASPWYRDIVSKKKPLNIYNGVSLEEIDDTYIVRWDAHIGIQSTSETMIMKETNGEGERKLDEFIKTDGTSESMEDVTSFVGIYFSDPTGLLGENGEIRVYNDDTDELLKTFTKNNWSRYSSSTPYIYKEPVKHIRIETSNVNAKSSISVYHVKEIDDNKIIEKYTEEEFSNLEYIKATLTGYLGENHDTDIDSAIYVAPVSIADISISKTQYSTQETEKNVQIKIQTKTNEYQEKWTNGTFLVKLPKDIIDVQINSVNINNNSVKIIDWSKYEEETEEGIERFIKIYTENEKPASYQITIDCNITPDPTITTKTEKLELYAHNEYNPNYYYSANDIYDVNDNGNVIEIANYRSTSINLYSPNLLLTSQMAINKETEEIIAIAPQIAEVTKEEKTAKIRMNITNNYSSTIEDVKILGMIPFEGNTYVINGGNMGSNFTSKMKASGIILPEELQGKAVVYYSNKENPNIENASDWTTTPNFNEVKTFLIEIKEPLSVGKNYKIDYEIELPEGLNYNQISYSNHAVYFNLLTKDGAKLPLRTEPNKLGFKIAKKYNLELTKYQKYTTKLVQGATYRVQAEGEDTKTKVTGEDGKLELKNLYVDKAYTVKEIKSPSEYELNEEEIHFKVIEENGELKIVDKVGITKKLETVKKEGEDWKVVLELEDEVKARLKIVKEEQGNEYVKIKGVRFRLTGKGMLETGRILTTNTNGEISLKGLYIGEEYTLEEVKAEGYYLIGSIKFVITNENGNYKVNIREGKEAIKEVENLEQTNLPKENEIPTLNLNIENEKISTYDLVINKVKKGETEPVVGAKFRLYKGEKALKEYTTNSEGKIREIQGLYAYNSAKPDYDQTYTLKETYAPDGYARVEDITFYAEEGTDGVLTMHKTEGELKEIQIENRQITITIEDSPTFKLIKKGEVKNSEDTKVLAGVKFAIYDYETGKPAKDNKGKIIGEENLINGRYYYIVETDEKGQIVANLPDGIYKAVEIETQEEYELVTEEKERTYLFGIGKSREEVRKWQSVLGARVGGSGYDKITAIAETRDGGIVVGGHFNSSRIVLDNGQVLEKKRFF